VTCPTRPNAVNLKTLCVILHYGDERETWACAATVAADAETDIVVADNDPAQSLSTPPDLADRVRIFRTGGRAGFAEGNNQAVSAFLSDAHDSVFILNNDTLVQPGAIALLRGSLHQPGVGIVGPCMPYARDPGKIWACGGRINSFRITLGGIEEPPSDAPFDVGYLPGAAIMCHAELWIAIGGLPERYFLAYEEAEFALEVRRLGYRVIAEPRASIFHHVGMSSQPKPMYRYNDIRSRVRFGQYLHGRWRGTMLAMLITAYEIKGLPSRGLLQRIRLWSWAVVDELLGRPLDRERLFLVADRAAHFAPPP
jgi:GT2 family glycosyltransferase